MNRIIMLSCVIAVSAILQVHGAVLCSGESDVVTIDLTFGTRTAALSERIRYSTEWVSGTGTDAQAVVMVDNETLKSATGSGFVDWTPTRNGTYTLTHKVMSGDEQVGETLTATFIVEGLNPGNPVISPESGTIFDGSLSVTMSCPTEGATIYYTTDSTEPTTESTVYRRFRITGKTTVKAVAYRDGLLSDVVMAEYALGRCADPVISLADGTTFAHSGQEVSISWTETDGVLRYTLDGSEPTAESPVYEGAFTISESTVVKAKVFSDDYFDSAVVTANLTRVWEKVTTPVIEAAASFTGSKTKVTLACATEGALIRYTLNGNDPNSHSTKYTGPFYVTESCTIKAYAIQEDYLDSAVSEFTIEKLWGIGDSMGAPDQTFTTGGNMPFFRVTDTTAPNGEAMRSGMITHNQISTLATTVVGPGTLSFMWRISCEEDPDGLYEWDHAEFYVDGEVVRRLDGEHSWQTERITIVGDGTHTVEWRYVKDDVESEGEDAVWVTGFQWESVYTATQTTAVPVPYAWLRGYFPELADEYEAYEVAAKASAANSRFTVEEAYVAGFDPTDPQAAFRAFIAVADDDIRVWWSPNLNTNGIERIYKVWGKTNLTDTADWMFPTNSAHRFYKVTVEMP